MFHLTIEDLLTVADFYGSLANRNRPDPDPVTLEMEEEARQRPRWMEQALNSHIVGAKCEVHPLDHAR